MDAGDWMPLIGVALGSMATFGMTTYTQRRTDARELAKADQERLRSAESSAREERARTFEHRRIAYEGFISAWHNCSRAAEEPGPPVATPTELIDVWFAPLADAQSRITLYGSKAANEHAYECVGEMASWLIGGGGSPSEGALYEHVAAFTRFRAVVRYDLGIDRI